MVLALRTSLAIRTLRNAHSVFGLGFAASTGLGSCNSVLIFLGDSSVARSRVNGSGCAIRSLRYARSIFGLRFAAVARLSSCYSVLILFGHGSIARIWVHSSSSLTVAAHGPTPQVFDTILRKQARGKTHTRHYY